MRSNSRSLASRAILSILTLTVALSSLPVANAFNWAAAPSPNIVLDDLGRVAFAGDFNGLSLYQYLGQNEATFYNNGSQSVLARLPNNGAFGTVVRADAHIVAMCSYTNEGQQRVVVAGNFTSLDAVNQTTAIAFLDPNNGDITAMPGIVGRVNAVYCDTDRLYVGGAFDAGGLSTNAVIWTDNWIGIPFDGFNGPVNSITKSNGNIIFGGDFNALSQGSADRENFTQVIPLNTARVTSGGTTTQAGFDDPRSIICKTAETDGPGNTWLLADRSPGFWQANFDFGFEPTKVRLYQTQQPNRGVRTWRYTALPDTGIMNLTYTDANGQTAFCDQQCPLPQGNSSFQDFAFVNSNIGMNGFRIDVSDWYGDGAGLAGIELFQNDIYTFAINDFNEPTCDGVSQTQALSTTTGPWIRTPSGASNSDYLSIRVNETVTDGSSTSVVFRPNLDQSGNYTVRIFTPGCTTDGTCASRGHVNITGTMQNPSATGARPVSTDLFQTNNFDKYDEVYYGFIDATSSGFQPTITLQPFNNQGIPEAGFLTVVAQRVRFELINATSGSLNGLYEYNPDNVIDESTLSSSAINRAGSSLSSDAMVNQVVDVDGDLIVAGNFTSDSGDNIFRISNGDTSSLAEGGLNAGVISVYRNGSTLYIGGGFTRTRDGQGDSFSGIASYSTAENTWTALGAGVNGMVQSIVPFSLNVTQNNPEEVLALSGTFDSVRAFGNNQASPAQGFAVWVPSQSNWLQNLDVASSILLSGYLSAFTGVPDQEPLYAGSVSSQAIAASGAVELNDDPLSLSSFPLRLQAPSSSTPTRKRSVAVNGQNITGAAVGTFWTDGGEDRVVTAIGGRFVATGSDDTNITNLAIINADNAVSGLRDELPTDSTFLALAHRNNFLVAGGSVTGTVNDRDVNGLVVYDVQTNALASTQPQALDNDGEVVVHAVVASEDTNSQDFFVGGDFDNAGGLACPGLCVYNTERSQWTAPQTGFEGTVSMLQWKESDLLVIGGNLTVDGNATNLITYNTESRTYIPIPGAESLPGAVTAYATGSEDGEQFWVAGIASNGSAFLDKYDGSSWQSVGYMLGEGSSVRGIQLFSVNPGHDNTGLLDENRVILLMGSLNVTGTVTASSALFNGTGFTPFLLSTTSQNTPGSISYALIQNPRNIFRTGGRGLAVGFVVLIALAISLGLLALLVIVGVLAERWRRRRDGYMPANQNMFGGSGGSGNVGRIRPQDLFGTIGKKDAGPHL